MAAESRCDCKSWLNLLPPSEARGPDPFITYSSKEKKKKKKLLGGGGTWHYQYTPTHKDGLFQTRAHTHAEKEKRKKIKATPIVTRQFSRSPSWV